MIVWVVVGTILCIRLVGAAAGYARGDEEKGAWSWLIFAPCFLLLLSNLGGVVTWGSIMAAFGAVVALVLPLLISGALASKKLPYYFMIWTIYSAWGVAVFAGWVRFCLNPFRC